MMRTLALLLLLLLIIPALGCVERKLVVRPDPGDATVFVDGVAVATVQSRAIYRYEHYGIHEVVVRKPGYAVEGRLVTLDPPWYQVFPIDFFFDVLWPATIEDAREIEVRLERRKDLEDAGRPGRAVMERARELERAARGARGAEPPRGDRGGPEGAAPRASSPRKP